MKTPDAPSPDEGLTHRLRRTARRPWPWLAIAAFAIAGGLFVTSSMDAQGTDLRAGSVTDLSTLVRGQRADTDALQQRVADLSSEVNTLSRGVGDSQVIKLQRQVDELRGPSGLRPVAGPGVTVTLQDAPQEVLDEAVREGEPPGDTLVVHQQDIQAVVNALWLGGAEAISIMNQRIISTTGIKCAGPTVILHGVPYSPPYRIQAVGDPADLLAALDGSDYIDAYRTVADSYGLGYEVSASNQVEVPGYEGTLELRYARPLATTKS